jgi:hypothetical protein
LRAHGCAGWFVPAHAFRCAPGRDSGHPHRPVVWPLNCSHLTRHFHFHHARSTRHRPCAPQPSSEDRTAARVARGADRSGLCGGLLVVFRKEVARRCLYGEATACEARARGGCTGGPQYLDWRAGGGAGGRAVAGRAAGPLTRWFFRGGGRAARSGARQDAGDWRDRGRAAFRGCGPAQGARNRFFIR